MEARKTIFDYLSRVFAVFGMTLLCLLVIGHFFGDQAREVSTLFRLGSSGLATGTMLQFLAVSAAVTFFRFLFFTDSILKKMSMALRTVGMLLCVIAVIVVMTLLFGWFPVDMWESWAMFFLCFGICFALSVALTLLREKLENKKMAEALEKLKQQEARKK